MRLFSKYLLVLTSAPIIIYVVFFTIGYLIIFIANLVMGVYLPLMGIFSGMIGANQIFKEFLMQLFFSGITLGLLLGALYFSYKFFKIIWHDLHVKSSTIFSFLFFIFILTIFSQVTGVYVMNFFSQLQSIAPSPEKINQSYSSFILLFLLLPYVLLIVFYTHQRDKSSIT